VVITLMVAASHDSNSDFCMRLAEAQNGSSDIRGQLLEEFRQYLELFAGRSLDPELQPKASKSDIVQQSFLEALADFKAFRGSTRDELRCWLKEIVRNNIANVRRVYQGTQKRDLAREIPLTQDDDSDRTKLAPVAPDLSPSGVASQHEEVQRLQQAVQRLPEHYRDVVLLYHRDHRTFEEIAAQLGKSAEAIRKVWARAVERLAAELKPPHARPSADTPPHA
jgi:RNA polymerase sigma-70 factor, ECF subfamily